jgi:hypothetical protein
VSKRGLGAAVTGLGALLAQRHASDSEKSFRAIKSAQSFGPSRDPSPSPRSPACPTEAAEMDPLAERDVPKPTNEYPDSEPREPKLSTATLLAKTTDPFFVKEYCAGCERRQIFQNTLPMLAQEGSGDKKKSRSRKKICRLPFVHRFCPVMRRNPWLGAKRGRRFGRAESYRRVLHSAQRGHRAGRMYEEA